MSCMRAVGACGIANQRPGWSWGAKWKKAGRMFLSTMHRINYRGEKHEKTIYESQFCVQKLTWVPWALSMNTSIMENFATLACE